jgi:hypothetical protein
MKQYFTFFCEWQQYHFPFSIFQMPYVIAAVEAGEKLQYILFSKFART